MHSFKYSIEKMLRLIILYLLLHTARSAINFGYQSELDHPQEVTNDNRESKHRRFDQILSSLDSLIQKRAKTSDDNNISDSDNELHNYHNYNKTHFEDILSEVTSALDQIKAELIKFNKDGVLTVQFPDIKHPKRYKRGLSNVTLDALRTKNNVTKNVTTTEKPATVTENNVLRTNNDTVEKEILRASNDNSSGAIRRMMPMYNMIPPPPPPPPRFVAVSSRVKDKLLSYLDDTFREVENKIKPLTNIKIALSNDDHYRIGYIIATIDTLEVNLNKLKQDMNLHHHMWDDEKILDLFDRIKATNNVATSLIDLLKKYLPRQ